MTEIKVNKPKSKVFSPNRLIFIITFIFSFSYHFFDMNFLDGAINSVNYGTLDNYFLGVVALIYVFSAFITILGLLLPNKWGAKITLIGNQEDLADYRRMLWGTSIYMMAIGIGLLILIRSGESGYFSPITGFSAVTIAYALTFIIVYKEWPHYDEILRKAVIEASHICVLIIITILWFWCGAAWIGWLDTPSPLGLLAMVNIAYMFSISLTYQRLGLFLLGGSTNNYSPA